MPPISIPILKTRSPAHDGGRPRMKTPPRARTAALGEQRKRAGNSLAFDPAFASE